MKWIFFMVWACGMSLIVKGEKTVASIAKAGDYYASNQAKRMINEVIAPTYERAVKVPELGDSQQLIQLSETDILNADLFLQPSVKAIPNPAKEQTTFYFRLPEKVTNGEILITNLFGQLVDKITISEEIGKMVWNTMQLQSDVYIYTLYAEGKIIATDRLVITK